MILLSVAIWGFVLIALVAHRSTFVAVISFYVLLHCRSVRTSTANVRRPMRTKSYHILSLSFGSFSTFHSSFSLFLLFRVVFLFFVLFRSSIENYNTRFASLNHIEIDIPWPHQLIRSVIWLWLHLRSVRNILPCSVNNMRCWCIAKLCHAMWKCVRCNKLKHVNWTKWKSHFLSAVCSHVPVKLSVHDVNEMKPIEPHYCVLYCSS